MAVSVIMISLASPVSFSVSRPLKCAGPPKMEQYSGGERMQRGGGVQQVMLPHLPLGFPEPHPHLLQHDADESLLTEQPRCASPCFTFNRVCD
jgi:hypothetical protein